jgi:uncharacterized protein (TIGR00255 family)
MKSMTGYAGKEFHDREFFLSAEIKGYNSRYLEISVNLPPGFGVFESSIREIFSSRFSRGKIEINIRLREYGEKIAVTVNTEAAKAYTEAAGQLAAVLKTDEKPSLSLIMGMDGVLQTEKQKDESKYWPVLEELLVKTAEDFEAERAREGKHTEKDIFALLSNVETSLAGIEAIAPSLESSIKENLRQRFAELLGDRIDENRILSETAVLLMKYTISEEISRLGSHLEEFRAEAVRNPSPGKKLDFLCQEINREINTIGSKTPQLEVSRAVVEMKNALEDIREQLRNIE